MNPYSAEDWDIWENIVRYAFNLNKVAPLNTVKHCALVLASFSPTLFALQLINPGMTTYVLLVVNHFLGGKKFETVCFLRI
jgi:hypothetical protein